MNQSKTNRIESLDLLKGLVMVIMALDHVRDYFHNSAYLFDPADPLKTNTALFFTRWITHFCAPSFSFLAGVSAYLVGKRKSRKELSYFLLKRGFWLVFIELTVVGFGWYFDIHFQFFTLLVIWSLGISMITLAGLVHFSMKHIFWFSLLVIFGHNLLDNIHIEQNVFWSMIHKMEAFHFSNGIDLMIAYPIIPWIGIMSLGYYFGSFYDNNIEPATRRKLFSVIGLSVIALFVLIRLINLYGNFNYWQFYETFPETIYSFLNPSKYPPSLSYILMTLGPLFLFLGNTEKINGPVSNFFRVFGKVPFFYYIIHIYVIHLLALVLAEWSGFGWQEMILKNWVTFSTQLVGYGLDLWAVYLIWIGLIFLLYPLCKIFSDYKLRHKEKTWLSYF